MTPIAGFPLSSITDILSQLPEANIPRLREVCWEFKQQIDVSPAIQARLSHLFLSRMSLNANIPLHDLHFEVSADLLSIQIQNDLSVHHFTHELIRVHPWIGRLAIKDCQADLLNALLGKTLPSKSLKALFLCNCNLSNAATAQLEDLAKENRSAPVVYLCNVTMQDGGHLPNSLLPASKRFRFIDPKEANSFSLQRLDENERARDALERFEKEVDTWEAPLENVLSAFNRIPNFFQGSLVSKVWTMVLGNCDKGNIDRTEIEKQGFAYIKDHPHHPAILAAIDLCFSG